MTKQQKADEEVVKVERKRDLEMKKKVEEHNVCMKNLKPQLTFHLTNFVYKLQWLYIAATLA